MDVIATIDYAVGDDEFEMTIGNFDVTVKVEAPQLFKGPIYIDRQQLIQALCALDTGA